MKAGNLVAEKKDQGRLAFDSSLAPFSVEEEEKNCKTHRHNKWQWEWGLV